jgi:hypothetical protein
MSSLKQWMDARPPAAVEAEEREEQRLRATQTEEIESKPFNPRTEISADARYLLRNLVLWFLALPVGLAIVLWAITR